VTAVTVASVGMAVSTFVGGTVAAAAPWLLVRCQVRGRRRTGTGARRAHADRPPH
jgi:hypothetical protein